MENNSAEGDVEQTLIDAVVAHMRAAEPDIELGAPVKASAKRASDGAYRTVSLKGDETFLFQGMRQGKRKRFVFEFAPVDAREYTQVEFGEDELLSVFPKLIPHLIQALGADPQKIGWSDAVKAFRSSKGKELKRLKREREEAAKTAEKNHYANDPEWGAW